MSEKKDKANEISKGLKEIGFKLIREGFLPKDLLKIVAQPFISEKELRERLNNE